MIKKYSSCILELDRNDWMNFLFDCCEISSANLNWFCDSLMLRILLYGRSMLETDVMLVILVCNKSIFINIFFQAFVIYFSSLFYCLPVYLDNNDTLTFAYILIFFLLIHHVGKGFIDFFYFYFMFFNFEYCNLWCCIRCRKRADNYEAVEGKIYSFNNINSYSYTLNSIAIIFLIIFFVCCYVCVLCSLHLMGIHIWICASCWLLLE